MGISKSQTQVFSKIAQCRLCENRFATSVSAHEPRPIVWASPGAKVLIAGQAPGIRVHESGQPFTDRSGDRLRDWLGLTVETFYDKNFCAILPMAFCFPGYNAKGHDLAPPKICAKAWRVQALEALGQVEVKVLIGGYAQAWHLRDGLTMQVRMQKWRSYGPDSFVLPHPSWRNNGWIKRNPWFETELIPVLQNRILNAREPTKGTA